MSHPSDTPHSSHVESRSRKALRSYIIQASTLLEIVLSGLVLIGLLLSFIPLLKWMPGLLFDGNDVEIRGFLERALDIVIGVEFTRCWPSHSPGSSLEVLLYAIARPHGGRPRIGSGQPHQRGCHCVDLCRAQVLLCASLWCPPA